MTLLRRAGLLLASVLILAGCATPPQTPLPLAGDYFKTPPPGRVGVVVSELPRPDTYFPGAYCLLCMATASVANSSLTTHTRTLSTAELKPLSAELTALLRAQGVDAVVIDTPLRMDALPDRSGSGVNQSRKDFAGFRDRHKIDRLLVVDVRSLGFTRPYSAYIPTGEPRATLAGAAFIVNLQTNALEWYEPLDVSRGVEGKWDEGPNFPGLSNAYFQALEASMDQVKKPFIKP
jgi:hypothetical protein